jgi:Tol biopolymer transport system component
MKVVFASNRGGSMGLYIMNAMDGAHLTQLTSGSYDISPSFSPDGRTVVFARELNGGSPKIYTVNTDGTGLKRLTSYLGGDYAPRFSPDGRRILFSSTVTGDHEIYLMDAQGSRISRLTFSPATDSEPAFSPDGSTIAFSSNRDGNMEIYLMDTAGNDLRRLRGTAGAERKPEFSPDGTRIAFYTDRDLNNEIYTMDVGGRDHRRLTSNGAWDFYPAWAAYVTPNPQILLSGVHPGNYQIFVIDENGANERQLTHSSGSTFNLEPQWSPDGTRIVFSRVDPSISSREFICVMKADGTNQRCFPKSYHCRMATWSHDGTRILFNAWGNAIGNKIRTMDPDTGLELGDIYSSNNLYGFLPSAWSPNGTRVGFGDGYDCRNVYVINVDGTNLQQLTTSCEKYFGLWSPDGNRIVFGTPGNINVMNADGSNPQPIPGQSGSNGALQWTTDDRIFFVSDRDGVPVPPFGDYRTVDLYSMRPDGSNVTRITYYHAPSRLNASWRGY